VEIPDVVDQPTCLVEVLQNTDPKGSAAAIGGSIGRLGMQKGGFTSPYRVTAQGVGVAETTPVVIQSTYTRLF
jgi:Tfp pilus assembly protein PilX